MSVWALATWSGLYEPVGRIGRHGHSFAQLSAAGSLASTPKRGGRDRPEQPPRRPGPRGPPPGRARFTVSPARLAPACDAARRRRKALLLWLPAFKEPVGCDHVCRFAYHRGGPRTVASASG